jgi:hypothetical protein
MFVDAARKLDPGEQRWIYAPHQNFQDHGSHNSFSAIVEASPPFRKLRRGARQVRDGCRRLRVSLWLIIFRASNEENLFSSVFIPLLCRKTPGE